MVKHIDADVGEASGQRAIHLQPYLNRTIPYWGHPGYFAGAQWRSTVKNQPVAIICRDTLISNMLNQDWAVRLREPEQTELDATKKEIDHYTKVFTVADGDFDDHIALVVQDMLDLPFGGMGEIGREPDDKEGKVEWVEHVDGATLVPTGDKNWPVVQSVPDVPHRPIVFPQHSIARVLVSPSPNIRRKGWGMAPPEKIYLALMMLYRGDQYYANLLLDTPEAGILDLGDMSRESAEEWLEGFKSLFGGIDGFKVPVLYEHTTPAKWIPFNRPPIDMLYDSTTLKYAQLVCAGYGMRLSDIGMAEMSGDKTLAGVIRGERQTRKTGYAEVSSRLTNYFNKMLPDHLQFVWEENDEELKRATAAALSTYGLALGQLKRDGLLTPEETRMELAATGLLETEIDPSIIPEPEGMMMQGGTEMQQGQFDKGKKGKGIFGGRFGGGKKQEGKPSDKDRGKVSKQERGRVPPAQGGRGDTLKTKSIHLELDRLPEQRFAELTVRLIDIVKPSLSAIPDLALLADARHVAHEGGEYIPAPRLRKLMKPVLEHMIPQVQKTFVALSDADLQDFWLPNMQSVDFIDTDDPQVYGELDGFVTRQSAEELRELIETLLVSEDWWQTASTFQKAEILAIFKEAFELGLHDQAIDIVRSLYVGGLANTPLISPTLTFTLTNEPLVAALERSAATMVTNVNAGTKYFIKRIIVSSIREGITKPIAAQAIREGVSAIELLSRDGFTRGVIEDIVGGLIEMTEARSISIVNTELNRVANEGSRESIKRSGLKTKAWRHLGARGETRKGNEHPCPICLGNEELGFVDIDFLFDTVFKSGGPKDDGRAQGPPGHPSVCHCTTIFDEKELFESVKTGEYLPYLGD